MNAEIISRKIKIEASLKAPERTPERVNHEKIFDCDFSVNGTCWDTSCRRRRTGNNGPKPGLGASVGNGGIC